MQELAMQMQWNVSKNKQTAKEKPSRTVEQQAAAATEAATGAHRSQGREASDNKKQNRSSLSIFIAGSCILNSLHSVFFWIGLAANLENKTGMPSLPDQMEHIELDGTDAAMANLLCTRRQQAGNSYALSTTLCRNGA